MITLNVLNQNGDAVGSINIDPAEFGGQVNKQLLHDVVLMHLANQRAGTHSTLRRGEVAGSTKKLFRQKGTGNARVGTRRTNKRRGGGTAKGPRPRDYDYNEAIIVDDLKLPEVKTRHMAGVLKKLKVSGTCLIGIPEHNTDLFRAARNIDGVEIHPVSQFNTYTILRQKRLVLTRPALEALRQNGKKEGNSR
jgi:large subunit ribosomal protein L4